MIQIFRMNHYWIMTVFALFLLRPLLGFAEGSDPFDNTILTVDDNIKITEPEASIIDQEISSQSDTTVALDQPINTRYAITRYSMQGLIKSPNKTKMMFVAIDENVKFLLSLNDCLGLDCGFVTDIDKRGRVTFEDEKGIYRFQVGYSPFIVENKIDDMLQESFEAMDEDQPLNAEVEVSEQLSHYVEDLENETAVLEVDNLSLKNEIQVLSDSNIVLDDEILFLNEQIQELQTSIPELQNTITTQEETINQKQANINQLQEELQNSTAKQDTTASSDDADVQNLQNTITSLNATLENKSKIINDGENKISIQDKQIDSLQNNLDTILGDFNEKLNAKQELITNLESQLLIQSTTDATSSQEQSESSTEDLISTTTQSTENVSPANDIAGTEAASQSTTDATSSQEQSESSTDDLISTTENVSETNDITGDNLMVAVEDVNIRKMPSPNSPILGVLLKDSTINVKDTVQGWYKIITKEGKEGYIYPPMLKEKN
jgi:predicted  nucleic acid-binding Zn-ribbon protein